MVREIMVVSREELFKDAKFDGFKNAEKFDYEKIILNKFEYMEREKAEIDAMYKQPIAYNIIVNPLLKKVFVYQRSKKDKNYGEKRLQGKWSCGIGGHIERADGADNPIKTSMRREMEEEAKFNFINYKPLGYINYDSNDVGKVHFGILYVIETDSEIVEPKDSEIAHGKLLSIKELEDICNSPEFVVEDWTKIALEPLKKYFNSLK